MRVFGTNYGARVEVVSGFTDAPARLMHAADKRRQNLSIRNKKHKAGKIVPFSVQSRRRKPQNLSHGLPRNKCISCVVDADVQAAIKAEAKRRRIPVGRLIGAIAEVCVDDNLFAAILGGDA